MHLVSECVEGLYGQPHHLRQVIAHPILHHIAQGREVTVGDLDADPPAGSHFSLGFGLAHVKLSSAMTEGTSARWRD